MEESKNSKIHKNAGGAYKEYVAGLLAGVATVVTGHPFDTVKVNLQKHNTQTNGIKYKNGLQCTARILRTEGVKGLYRGATSSFVGMAVESSIFFGLYSQTKLWLQGGVRSDNPEFYAIASSGAFSGATISFVLCPTELVKCRMQVQGSESLDTKHITYKGPLDCALRTVKAEGISGIFRGGVATLLRESIGNSAFFCTYEYVRYHMRSRLKDGLSAPSYMVDVGVGILSGGLSGISFWCVTLPVDVAKTMIQTSQDKDSTRNPFEMLKMIYRRTGLRGCYAGLGPTIARAFPANAAAIVTWELAGKLLGIRHD
ncbi:transporter [Lithospermum erythrorhizon]|uniref:Transporter n=1 Tax=Lithospermum erythrorhizon TaxID=34254 RepID=A0AAV3P907_LITER